MDKSKLSSDASARQKSILRSQPAQDLKHTQLRMTFFSVLRRQSHRQSCEGSRRVSRRGLVLTPPWNRGNQAQYVGILALQVKLPHVCVQILMRSSSLRMYLPVPLTCRPSLKSSLISALLSRLEPPARSIPEPGPAQPGPSQPGLALSSLSCPSLNQPQRSQQQADYQELPKNYQADYQ